MLTKMDVAAIRQADDICVHLNARNPDGLVRLIKRKRYSDSRPFAEDIEHVLTAKVDLYGLRGRAELAAGTVECFAMCGLYHSQQHQVSLALRSARAGDELTFSFAPDHHTNGYVAAQSLHADALLLVIRRAGKTIARWDLDISITPSNSARMVRGVPTSEGYYRDADEARRVA